MTADWHLPAAAIVDYFKLTDITMLGFSLGGGLVIRAAAREPRISRVISMDVCTSLFEADPGFRGLRPLRHLGELRPDPRTGG
jgi:hypothetical protein